MCFSWKMDILLNRLVVKKKKTNFGRVGAVWNLFVMPSFKFLSFVIWRMLEFHSNFGPAELFYRKNIFIFLLWAQNTSCSDFFGLIEILYLCKAIYGVIKFFRTIQICEKIFFTIKNTCFVWKKQKKLLKKSNQLIGRECNFQRDRWLNKVETTKWTLIIFCQSISTKRRKDGVNNLSSSEISSTFVVSVCVRLLLYFTFDI